MIDLIQIITFTFMHLADAFIQSDLQSDSSYNFYFEQTTIKWMPPYWDNKALPTPTLTLPDTLFSTFLFFP